ncbi:MAG: hypothetical protein J3K34DRAFT_392933 [Monoraphidium minutum]|nr:MAG: hypothetical protein J3K34DRAFT_392933 [Monoraphidium minutum]
MGLSGQRSLSQATTQRQAFGVAPRPCRILIILIVERHTSGRPCGAPGETWCMRIALRNLKVGTLEKAAAARHIYRRAGPAETRAAARGSRRRRSCLTVNLNNTMYLAI